MGDETKQIQTLNPEYSTRFEQLNNKEQCIKIKVMFEIIRLVRNGDVEDAVAALPTWADHYQNLTNDNDYRVREVAQACHGALVRASGGRLTSALRCLLPTWVLACHDLHGPVAKLAQTHLESALPGSKLGDAISFCKSEIVTLLIDNLSGKLDRTLSEKFYNLAELEIELETERILSSSLSALEFFITQLPPERNSEWLWGKLKPFLESLSFWDLSIHESEYVRACWYSACGRICEREGPRLNVSSVRLRFGRALVSKERGSVDDQRWVAVLRLMSRVEEWGAWFEKKELLVERILNSLRNGGWGEPLTLSNTLLPILSKLPADYFNKDFYITLFNSIFTGLHNKHLLQSENPDTWIYILANCLRYLSLQKHDYVLDVVKYVHRTWLENIFSITDSKVKCNLIKYSATIMASLVEYWQKKSEEQNGAKYDRLVINFWQVTDSAISEQIAQSPVGQDDMARIIEAPMLLLKTLKSTHGSKGRMQRRIRRLFATLVVK